MGGRAAEALVLGRLTSGASDDLNRATNIAETMVYTLSPHWTGSRPEYMPSRLTGLVPAPSICPLASPDWSPPQVYTLSPHRTGPHPEYIHVPSRRC
eukprot:5892446-Pyramimonas_sp.AAC.1